MSKSEIPKEVREKAKYKHRHRETIICVETEDEGVDSYRPIEIRISENHWQKLMVIACGRFYMPIPYRSVERVMRGMRKVKRAEDKK